MFADIHRYLMQRHSDIERLKASHTRKNQQRKEALDECRRIQEHDAAERVAQITKFSEEMQRHTNRKVEGLQRELMEHEVAFKRGDDAIQFQIDRMVKEMDQMQDGLLSVADAMDVMGSVSAPN